MEHNSNEYWQAIRKWFIEQWNDVTEENVMYIWENEDWLNKHYSDEMRDNGYDDTMECVFLQAHEAVMKQG